MINKLGHDFENNIMFNEKFNFPKQMLHNNILWNEGDIVEFYNNPIFKKSIGYILRILTKDTAIIEIDYTPTKNNWVMVSLDQITKIDKHLPFKKPDYNKEEDTYILRIMESFREQLITKQ